MTPIQTLTRRETSEILGVSKAGVVYHHGRALHPYQDKNGLWQYSRDEVLRLKAILTARRRNHPSKAEPGALARQVFRSFDLGIPLAQIVQNLSVEPERVLAWYAIYNRGFDKVPVELTPEQQLAHAKLQFEIQAERNRVELAREKAQAAEQRRRDG